MRRVRPAGAGSTGHDPGLAGARTELAWSRTAISFAALGAAILHRAPVAGAVVIALAAAVRLIGRMPGARPARTGERPGRDLPPAVRRRQLRLVTIATVAVALTALVVAVLT